MPLFKYNLKWELLRHPFDRTVDVIGKIRPIGGHSLRIYCSMHKQRDGDKTEGKECKMHVNIACKFEQAQIFLARWQIFGCQCDKDSHIEEAARLCAIWRSLCK